MSSPTTRARNFDSAVLFCFYKSHTQPYSVRQCMSVVCEVNTIQIEKSAWIINQRTSQEVEGSNVYRLSFPPTIPFVSLMNVSAPLFHVRDAISMWESLWKTLNRIESVSASVSLSVYMRLIGKKQDYFNSDHILYGRKSVLCANPYLRPAQNCNARLWNLKL